MTTVLGSCTAMQSISATRAAAGVCHEFDLARLVDANFIDACALFRKRVWEDVGGYDEHMPHMGWEDWDFWLRAAVDGAGDSFTCRKSPSTTVSGPGSMLTEVNRHNAVMDSYLFSKKELVALGGCGRNCIGC